MRATRSRQLSCAMNNAVSTNMNATNNVATIAYLPVTSNHSARMLVPAYRGAVSRPVK
jgi:hypothetical protein